jgi:25S rRNA (adenine2142-N1)-methyltransferase
MLELIHQQLRPEPTSLLFLVLPLPCVVNSRYLSVSHLQELMAVVGFELVKERWKNGGKVGYWLWAWREPRIGKVRKRFERKQVLVDGPKKNNFSITLPSSEP